MNSWLFITPDAPPAAGGVARYVEGVLEQEGTRVILRSSHLSWPMPYGWLRSVWMLWRERWRYDGVLLTHAVPFGTAAWIASYLTRRPYAVILHGLDYQLARANPMRRVVMRRVLRGATRVITANAWLREQMLADDPILNIEVRYPILTQHIERAAREFVRPTLPRTPWTILTVARLVPRKGHLQALHAIAALPEEIRSKIRYRILGDGPQYNAIAAEIHTFGLESLVEFQRVVSDQDVLHAYRSSDVFLMPVEPDPIDREGLGIVYLEAAAFALPIIATDIPGVQEAVISNKTGLLVPPGDLGALTAALETLYKDRDLGHRLGDAGRTRILSQFIASERPSVLPL